MVYLTKIRIATAVVSWLNRGENALYVSHAWRKTRGRVPCVFILQNSTSI